jgi:hypothetical protein
MTTSDPIAQVPIATVPIATVPIATVIVQPIVLAGPAVEPGEHDALRARRGEIEALLPQRLARHADPALRGHMAVEIDWDAAPGRAGAWGLAAITVAGAVVPHGDRRMHALRAEAQAALRAACAECD